jgi:hypothetical protein
MIKHAHPHLDPNPYLTSWECHIRISCQTFTEHCTHSQPESPLPHLIACQEQKTIACPHPNPRELKLEHLPIWSLPLDANLTLGPATHLSNPHPVDGISSEANPIKLIEFFNLFNFT